MGMSRGISLARAGLGRFADIRVSGVRLPGTGELELQGLEGLGREAVGAEVPSPLIEPGIRELVGFASLPGTVPEHVELSAQFFDPERAVDRHAIATGQHQEGRGPDFGRGAVATRGWVRLQHIHSGFEDNMGRQDSLDPTDTRLGEKPG